MIGSQTATAPCMADKGRLSLSSPFSECFFVLVQIRKCRCVETHFGLYYLEADSHPMFQDVTP